MSIQNRRAKFDYDIKETYVAGIVLESNEVKPLRSGKASIQSSFINEQKGEIYINNFEIISRGKNFDLKKKTRSVKKLLLCLLYTSPSPRDLWISRMPSSA